MADGWVGKASGWLLVGAGVACPFVTVLWLRHWGPTVLAPTYVMALVGLVVAGFGVHLLLRPTADEARQARDHAWRQRR